MMYELNCWDDPHEILHRQTGFRCTFCKKYHGPSHCKVLPKVWAFGGPNWIGTLRVLEESFYSSRIGVDQFINTFLELPEEQQDEEE